MRSPIETFRLLFLLPKGLRADSGSHVPCPRGCTIDVDGPGVEIRGPSREAVFDHATRFLRSTAGHAATLPLSISAVLRSPPPFSGSDSWTIIVGADVAFSPTAIDPFFPSRCDDATAALVG